MKLLLIPGSLRRDSLNRKLAGNIESMLKTRGHQTEIVDLQRLNFPVYDGDIEAQGIPENVKKLGDQIMSAEALILVTPEYNGGIASPVKNMVDWISRMKPIPLAKKQLLILAASPGALGGVRGLWHTRVPFEVVGVHVYPEMFGLSKAHEAFDDESRLKDEKSKVAIEKLLDGFISYVREP